jgi:putative PEP-CTERM system TPR-repeat lipoprotein
LEEPELERNMSISNSRCKCFFIISSVLLSLTACDFGTNKSPEEHIEKAKSFFAEGKTSESVIELKNALQIESNLPEARWLLGKIYLQLGNGAAAFKEISQAQSLGFSHPELNKLLLQAMLLQGKNQDILDQTFSEEAMSVETLILRGNAHLGLKEFEEAKASFNEVLEIDNSSVAARKGLAQVALFTRKLDEAKQIIDETLSFALEDSEVWILKGQLAFLQNDALEAEKAFAKAVAFDYTNILAQIGLTRALLSQGKIDDALVPIEAVESRFSNHPLAKYFRGYIALLKKDIETAKVLLQEVISLVPEHPESLLLLSRIHYDEGQLAQAETHISTFLASYPGHLPALKLLSVIQLKLKQPNASIETLSDAASQAQGDWQVLALLGSALLESGDLEKGIELLEQATQINPNTAAIHTQLAIGHLVSGSLDSAVAELESAIELDPQLIRADILLILAHLKASKIEAAVAAAQALTEKHPDNPLAFNLLGAAYQGKDDVETAKAQFEKALALKPDFTPAIANLARLDMRDGDTVEAEKKLHKILEIDKNHSGALENLAQLEGQRGNVQKARSLLEQARSGNPAALRPRLLLSRYYLNNRKPKALLEVITEAYNIAPKHPEVLLLSGQAYRLNGDYEKSINTLGSLLKIAPDAQEVVFQLSLSQAKSGNTDVAKDNLEGILAKDKNHLGALIALTKLALNEKDYTVASKLVSKIKLTKEYAVNAHDLQGDIQIAQLKYTDAVESYKKVFAIVQNSNIIIKLAEAYKLSGNKDMALSILNDWIKEHPEDASTSLYLASMYQESTEDKQAIVHYEKTIELSPDNVIALNNLAWLYIDSDPERALELARKANEQVPDSPEIMDTLGWILVQQNKVEEGLGYLEPARSNSDIPDIQYHFAAGLKAAGDEGRALIEVTALLEEHEAFPTRKEAEKLLSSLE